MTIVEKLSFIFLASDLIEFAMITSLEHSSTTNHLQFLLKANLNEVLPQ